MRLPALRRTRPAEPDPIAGPARADRRTKRLLGRLRPGDVAVIDHVDLDRVTADALVAREVAAVVNAKPSISGRYPNLGPEVLVRAGVPLVDDVGEEVFHKVRDGAVLRLDGDAVYLGEEVVARGARQDSDSVASAMEHAKDGLSVQLEAFAANTMEYLKRERQLLLDGVGVPDVVTRIAGRHAVIVVRGYDYESDLELLRPYLERFTPVLIGVDGGADALVEARFTPDMVIGDMDAVSDEVLRCGAEIVVRAHPDGRAPGLTRIQQLGLSAVTFPAAATSQDIALLLADDKGAELIVTVGAHATLAEFLDRGRGGMASTFLTRLRAGGKLVDAKAVARLFRHSPGTSSIATLVVTALAAMAATLSASTVGRSHVGTLAEQWDNLLVQAQRLLL
ncbi:MAG: hypothetical protein GEU94_03450 [Micromonosporaceae bacterium]|nr:hypothetical protein [Micromonosporaceae bacterium]